MTKPTPEAVTAAFNSWCHAFWMATQASGVSRRAWVMEIDAYETALERYRSEGFSWAEIYMSTIIAARKGSGLSS